MGPVGMMSRVACELSGSCMTFGAVGQVITPGQIQTRKILAALLAVVLCAGCAFGTEGVIGWAAGGGTDTLMRLLASQLDEPLTLTNRTGLAGAVATLYVYGKDSDGQAVLMNAETPSLYKLLGYSDIDYGDFECVLLAATEVVGVIVPVASKWKSFSEIVEAAKNGQEIIEATTNVGGMPWTLTAMLGNVTGVTFIQEWYRRYGGKRCGNQRQG